MFHVRLLQISSEDTTDLKEKLNLNQTETDVCFISPILNVAWGFMFTQSFSVLLQPDEFSLSTAANHKLSWCHVTYMLLYTSSISLWSDTLSLCSHLSHRFRPSYGDGGVRGGEVLHAETNHLAVGWRPVQEVAGEDLVTGLTKILRQEGVEDGVNAGVPIRQAVCYDAEGEGGVIQGEGPKLYPHGDDVMRHPADGECSDEQENRLSRL